LAILFDPIPATNRKKPPNLRSSVLHRRRMPPPGKALRWWSRQVENHVFARQSKVLKLSQGMIIA
jgi:hypothetical protein